MERGTESRVDLSASHVTQARGKTQTMEQGQPKALAFRKKSYDGWRNTSLAVTQGKTGSDTCMCTGLLPNLEFPSDSKRQGCQLKVGGVRQRVGDF